MKYLMKYEEHSGLSDYAFQRTVLGERQAELDAMNKTFVQKMLDKYGFVEFDGSKDGTLLDVYKEKGMVPSDTIDLSVYSIPHEDYQIMFMVNDDGQELVAWDTPSLDGMDPVEVWKDPEMWERYFGNINGPEYGEYGTYEVEM